MSRALALLLIVTLVLFACVSRLRSAPAVPATVMAELARLRSENDRLKLRLSSCEAIAARAAMANVVRAAHGRRTRAPHHGHSARPC